MHVIDDFLARKQRVAIYIRVSTKLQEDRYSLSGQRSELTHYATAQGWDIVGVFQDVDSGAKLDKAGLDALLDCVEDGKVDIVLVIEQDRLSRLDAAEWEFLKDVLRENNVRIAEPGSMIDLTNEDDEFISDLKNIFARHTRRKIKRTTGRGRRQYAREGKVMGKLPGEYLYDRNTHKPVINEERSWIIPFIDRLFLEEKMSKYRIAKELSKLITTENGKDWSETQIDYRLRSKAFHGVLERTFANGETITTENVFPALRTKETYEKIQIRLDKTAIVIKPTGKFNHALRSVRITCKHCGRVLGLTVNVNPSGRRYVSVSHKKLHSPPCTVSPAFNAYQLTRNLFQLVKSILLDRDTVQQYLESEQNNKESVELLVKESDMLRLRIKNNEDMLDRLLALYLSGKWSVEKLDENKETIELQNKELSERVLQIEQKLDLFRRQKYNLDSFLEVIGSLEEYLAIFMRMDEVDEPLPFELDDQDQEKLIAKMFDGIEVDWLNHKATVYGKSIENVPVVFTIEIDKENVVDEYFNKKKRYERYQNVVEILKSSEQPVKFMDLVRQTGHKPETLNRDAAEFGPYPNLIPKEGSPERTQWLLDFTKQSIQENRKISAKDIAKKAGASNNTILKLIKEYNLR